MNRERAARDVLCVETGRERRLYIAMRIVAGMLLERDHVLDAIDAQADAMPEGPAKEATEDKADAVEAAGEEKANAMDDKGEIAPSETGTAPATPPADPAKK